MKSKKIKLAAIERYTLPVSDAGRVSYAAGCMQWGRNNDFPNEIYSLYLTSPTLQSLVDGITQHVADGQGEELDLIAFQLALFGAFALRVDVARVGVGYTYEVLDWRFLRWADEEGSALLYSKNFGDFARKHKVERMRLFDERASIFENKGSVLIGKRPSFQVYPIPPIASAFNAAYSEQLIGRFHVAALQHGFAGNLLVNFNNGDTDDDIKAEIERNFIDKFNGADNAGSIVFSWNENKDTATTITPIAVEDFGEKFKELATSVKQQIFTAYRVNPNIFGLPTEGTGFSGEEYEHSYALFLLNVVKPAQQLISATLSKIGCAPTFKEKEEL